ncbi:hypothetical protein BH20VER2_BH20VER2_14930 [soil metagenome]
MPKRPSSSHLNAIVLNSTTLVKNPAAVQQGKLGGQQGGPARAKALAAQQRREVVRDAARKHSSSKLLEELRSYSLERIVYLFGWRCFFTNCFQFLGCSVKPSASFALRFEEIIFHQRV